jgi:hypothetical protein
MKFATPIALALMLALGGASALAADAAQPKPLTPQQQRTGDCAKQAHAKGLKGDEYKAFMSSCMKGESTTPTTTSSTTPAEPAEPAKPMTQQEKMKACNADATAKGLKGDERKKFMSSCLKGGGGDAAPAH